MLPTVFATSGICGMFRRAEPCGSIKVMAAAEPLGKPGGSLFGCVGALEGTSSTFLRFGGLATLL